MMGTQSSKSKIRIQTQTMLRKQPKNIVCCLLTMNASLLVQTSSFFLPHFNAHAALAATLEPITTIQHFC